MSGVHPIEAMLADAVDRLSKPVLDLTGAHASIHGARLAVQYIPALTPAERALLNKLADVWNGFLELPQLHVHDNPEMQTLIHQMQEKIMARPVAREFIQERDRG